jgi:dihydroorotase
MRIQQPLAAPEGMAVFKSQPTELPMTSREGEGLTRRELLQCVGGSLAVSATAREPRAGGGDAPAESYDLVIKGGKVVDPSQDLEAVRDVAVRAGKIVRIASDIPAHSTRNSVDARGKIVTPGLIDLHTHVFPWVGPYGIEADPYCVHRGVTSVIDAGTSGALTFPAFRRYDIERSRTRIRALLHVVAIGMVAGSTPNMGELEDLRYCVPEMAVKAAEENKGVIVGFKVRFSRQYTGPNDYEGMKRARRADDRALLPLMMHIGGSYTPLPKLLALMRKGDVVTHTYNSHPHGILDVNGKLLPEVLGARRRGVLFDVGHGAGSFSFAVMEKCLSQNFLPDTISSDLYSANIHGPVFDLVTTLSKFLLLGLSLSEVIRRATVNAAAVFDFGARVGTLKPGAEADLSVLELQEGDFTFTDSDGKTRPGKQKLLPVVTVRGGELYYPPA